MNKIIKRISDNRSVYCHVLECSTLDEVMLVVDELLEDFISFKDSDEDIIDFFETIELYCLNDENENAFFNFDMNKYVKSILDECR